jgi:uncharacterized damage-inducible protein DinB
MNRPAPDEYDPYFATYIDKVEGDDLLGQLAAVQVVTRKRLSGISEAEAEHRYAAGKWSIKEILAHLIDGERIFCARAVAFARGDRTALPGFDENAYAAASNADRRPLSEILEELAAVRAATIALFRSFDEAELSRSGIASESRISVRALGFAIAGHELHHRAVIEERYLRR